MTEDVKIRVIGDADQMIAEMQRAIRALRQVGTVAQKTATAMLVSLKSIEFQVVARNIADVAQKLGHMAAAAYEMATAWRDARKEIGDTAGLDSLISGVDEAEESVRRIRDSFGALAASMLQEFAPALDVAAGKIRDFTVGAAFVIERVSLALTYLTQGEEAAFRQWTEHQGQLQALSVSLLQSSESQIEAQERATGSTQRQTRALKEQRDIVADFEAAWLRSAEASAAAAVAADIATSAALKQADAEGRAKIEAAAQIRDAEIAAAQQADAELVASKEAATAAILSNAAQGASILASLSKKGSKEAAAIQKASALFSIFVDTRAAFTNALASIPAPFNVPAAISVAALGAAQGIAVASAQPPSFDRGGVVDGGPQYPGGRPGQRLAQVEDGEMVLTRRMQEAMGGREQTVILKVGSREFGRAVIASGATDGLQRRRGVGQRRYGG